MLAKQSIHHQQAPAIRERVCDGTRQAKLMVCKTMECLRPNRQTRGKLEPFNLRFF